jgi:hypothetical protein
MHELCVQAIPGGKTFQRLNSRDSSLPDNEMMPFASFKIKPPALSELSF